MNDIKKKLDEFSAAVLTEADLGSKEILDAIERERERAIAAAEAEIQQETTSFVKAKFEEIKGRESRRVSSAMMENRRQLFLMRGEFADEVFDLVREKISKFTGTYEYFTQLNNLLGRALSELGNESDVIVYLRNEDMGASEELTKLNTGAKLTYKEGNFILGGLMAACPTKNISIDMTFDAALDDLTGHFAEMFGLGLA